MYYTFFRTQGIVWGLLFVLLAAVSPARGNVTFPDPILEAAIRSALEQPSGPITTADLAGLTELRFQRSELRDLSGLEHCVNLTSLAFYEHKITNLECVTTMKDLEYLSLFRTRVTDLTPLRDLTNLTQLNLQEIPTKDLSPLKGLHKLRYINLGGIRDLDLRPLSELASLEQLNLHAMGLTDLNFAAPLTKLRIIDADRNDISSLDPLRNLHNLEDLYLDDNRISDISPLAEVTSVRRLYLRRNQLSDLSGFPTLREDSTVLLMENQITDIRPVVEASGRTGDIALEIGENPLSFKTICEDFHEFEARGNRIYYEHSYQEERATRFADSYAVCGAADRADRELILAAVSRGASNEELEKRFGLRSGGAGNVAIADTSASPPATRPEAGSPTPQETIVRSTAPTSEPDAPVTVAAGGSDDTPGRGIILTLETPGLIIKNHIGETLLLGVAVLLFLAWRFPRTAR